METSDIHPLGVDDFAPYFRELHGHDPYPWQRRLAERAVIGDWPGAIDLPTGSGKTACLDIAVFALAHQAALPPSERSAARRLFFCVNRRVIVDEAFRRARRIATSLWQAERDDQGGVLAKVAAGLRRAAGSDRDASSPPLDAIELRGGIFRDNRWARSIRQPTVICTTLDQLGSRLLFRGYGVSAGAAPIQAALIAYDSLILLDEAHISRPFLQTLQQIRGYLEPERWAASGIGVPPVAVVPMTATPSRAMRDRGVLALQDDDRQVVPLQTRLQASKPAGLEEVRDVAKGAIDAAIRHASDGPAAIGIIVNRVATAREIYEQLVALREETDNKKRKIPRDAVVEVVIGSMRPIDRDDQSQRLEPLVGPDRPQPHSTRTSFVVATQCLEVGADYDFDVLISECASLDSLRQRFGRLNRAGRPIDARGVILIKSKDAKAEEKLDDDKPADPIYGNALARTWNWLRDHATDDEIDLGIDRLAETLGKPDDDEAGWNRLVAPAATANAPLIMPGYVDLWCQTAPRPALEPDVGRFVHGQQGNEPDVQVCWRADLVEEAGMTREQWCDVVALVPPTAAECVRVPISRVRRWLRESPPDESDDVGDLFAPGEAVDPKRRDRTDTGPPVNPRVGVLWRGVERSELLDSPEKLRPGATVVFPASLGESRVLGHFPDPSAASGPRDGTTNGNTSTPPVPDLAELAWLARDRAMLRVHPSLRECFPGDWYRRLVDAVQSDDADAATTWASLLSDLPAGAVSNNEPSRHDGAVRRIAEHLRREAVVEWYPDRRGCVLISRRPLGSGKEWYLPAIDDGEDDGSRSSRVYLQVHLGHVDRVVAESLKSLPLDNFVTAFRTAARCHDWGKADERFQAMLRRTDRTDAYLLLGGYGDLLAKSEAVPRTKSDAILARQRAGLPTGFRHEMLSLQLLQSVASGGETPGDESAHATMPDDETARDLLFHLVAAHHGHARPYAPVVTDEELPAVAFDHDGIAIDVDTTTRRRWVPPHRADSGISERFWKLTRHFGWWGLAYLEAVLRLADQQASAAESSGERIVPAETTTSEANR